MNIDETSMKYATVSSCTLAKKGFNHVSTKASCCKQITTVTSNATNLWW